MHGRPPWLGACRCGNGIRCLARFVADVDGAAPRQYRVHTLAGLIQPTLLPDGQVRAGKGREGTAWQGKAGLRPVQW